MAVRTGADDVEGTRQRGADGGIALQHGPQRIDFSGWPVGEIGDGAVVDFAVFAEALAEEDSGRGVAIGDNGYIHVDRVQEISYEHKRNLLIYMTTQLASNLRKSLSTKESTCD